MAVGIFSGNDLQLIDGVDVDVKVGEYHTVSATVTAFAVENGAVISDHIVLDPDRLEIAWEISNVDGQGQSYGTRAATIFDTLRQKLRLRQLYQVVTRHHLYSNMALTSIVADHVGSFAGRLIGRVSFQAVRTPTLEVVDVPEAQVQPAVSKTASSTVDSGRQDARPPTPQRQQSLLCQLTGC